MITRVWPTELAQYMDNPQAVPLQIEGVPLGCPNCGGAGVMMVYVWKAGPFRSADGSKVKWLDFEERSKSGWYSGETKYAHCPVCHADGMADYLRRNSGLDGQDLEITLESFKVSGSYAEKRGARDQAAKLLGMNGHPSGIYTFWGGYGCGKSHLLKAIVNGFRKVGVVAQYQVMNEMLASIRERFGDANGGVRAEDVIENLQKVRVLCIDELDRVNLTSWVKETMFRIIDARYNRSDLATVLATNSSMETLSGEYGFGYIVSRINSGVIVEVPGPDVREALGVRARKVYGVNDD